MLARQFWIFTAFELAFYVFIAVSRCGDHCSGFAILLHVASIYVGVRLLLIAVSFVVAGIIGSRRPRGYRVGPLQAVWMYLQESFISLLTFSVLQPSESVLAMRNPPPGSKRSPQPILLVHGFIGNGGVWWGLRRRLLKLGFGPIYTLNLEPVVADIEDLGRCLKARVDEILDDRPNAEITLVCHSMGGLVARVMVDELGGGDRVRGIITLGTPHHGTALAHLLGGANVCQMRRNSEWLARLNGADAGSSKTPLISIFSYHDNIITPPESARLEWAENLPLPGLGHMALLYAPECQAVVVQALQRLWISRSG